MLIADQIRGPTVGTPVQDAVIALEPDAGRPQAERPSGVALTSGSQVLFAHGHGGPAGVAQYPRKHGR